MTTIATVFSGGEGVGTGARNAGLTHLWGIEYVPEIAAVAEDNGFKSIVADFLSVDPRILPVPDVFHASPVCKNASVANAKRGETQWDIDCGQHIAHFIDVMQPKIVTIENVWQYRDFEAFERIKAALERGGYMFDWNNLNAADYGVPQTRRRLILRAMKGWLPPLPHPERWVGWYEAIEDLIPTLPLAWHKPGQPCEYDPEGRECRKSEYCQGHLADWQLARLPTDELEIANEDEPSPSITAQTGGRVRNTRDVKAFLMSKTADKYGDGIPDAITPSHTIGANEHGSKAFIVDGDNAGKKGPITRPSNLPINTVNGSSSPRAWLSQGLVVKMTPRALARFQSFPDPYILPDKKRLACTVIWNSVCPLMYQKIIKQLMETL